MATRKGIITDTQEIKKTPTQLRKENEELREEVKKYQEGAYCYMCNKHKPKSEFYVSFDANIDSHITRICKQCARKLAYHPDEDGQPQEPTKASVLSALEYLDLPYFNKLWDTSYFECHDSNNRIAKKNIWTAYIKNITSLPQYKGLRWKDGDMFKKNVNIGNLNSALPSSEDERPEVVDEIDEKMEEDYLKNKSDVISQVGYDPFGHYQREEDKPFLYASLNSFIDEETKNDGMKLKAVIQIVKTYNQIEKINDTIDAYVVDPEALLNNIASLDKLSGTVDKLIRSSAKLAQDNGISVNFNNNKSKGANTLSGKIKHLSEIGFQDARINTFDIETCEGMKQVAKLSEEARHLQINKLVCA